MTDKRNGRDRRKGAVVPEGTVVPDGFVLVTRRSWHGVRRTVAGLLMAAFLLAGSAVALELQVSSRNRNIDQVTKAARESGQAAKDAKRAAEAGTAVLTAAIAQAQGGSGADLTAKSAVAVEQIKALCYAVVGQARCDQIEAQVRHPAP